MSHGGSRASYAGRDDRDDALIEPRPEIQQITGVKDAVISDIGSHRQGRVGRWDGCRVADIRDVGREAVSRQRRDECAAADARYLVRGWRYAVADPLVQIDDQCPLHWRRVERVAELAANPSGSTVAGAVLEARQQVITDIPGAAQIEIMA